MKKMWNSFKIAFSMYSKIPMPQSEWTDENMSLAMCFFPWIFSKAEVPAWYTYTTFIVLLIAALSGYFFNYKPVSYTHLTLPTNSRV